MPTVLSKLRAAPTAALGAKDVLTDDALAFVATLVERFASRRDALLATRAARDGQVPEFLAETAAIREGAWKVGPIPKGLQDRRVEITGPVERKMMVNALNSGAKVFMADFEDASSPTWDNMVAGQANIRDAVRGKLRFAHPTKGTYTVNDNPAKLVVRVRGWHLDEKHVTLDGKPVPAALVDFGLCFFHNARQQMANGDGPWFYLPKLEHHDEAALWDEVFRFSQGALDIPVGTIKATILIETLPAAFQMDEILHALREHIVGLNAGRWDYIFSCIKTLRGAPDAVLPDRGQVTMTVPFMHAYSQLLIKTCHKRGAFAMGGMSAFIPARGNEAVTKAAFAAVQLDKAREAADGCDGTWVAHPDMVALALETFNDVLSGRLNQLGKQRNDVHVTAADLLDLTIPGGKVTDAGVALNIEVALRYMERWLAGQGAVAIHNLMEDAATAEISRCQLWQWIEHGAETQTGPITKERVATEIDATSAKLAGETGSDYAPAAKLLHDCLSNFPAFLTLPAYEVLP